MRHSLCLQAAGDEDQRDPSPVGHVPKTDVNQASGQDVLEELAVGRVLTGVLKDRIYDK